MTSIRKTTGFATSFDGTPIFYEVRGEGPPIVLAYGIACLMNHWHHQIKYFSANYQVITLDYRGHHQSPAPQNRDNLTVDGCVEDIKAVLDTLGIKKASFWGHSWGAQILVRMWDLHPEYFANIVFVNGFVSDPITGMFGSSLPRQAFELIKAGYDKLPETAGYLWKKSMYNPIAIWFTTRVGGFNPQLTQLKDIEVYLKGVANIPIDVFIRLFEQMMHYDGKPVLDRITAPTLIVTGEKDFVTPRKHQAEFHKRIKGSEFMSVPFGSHCTQLDMPEMVNMRIEKFLQKHGWV